MKATTSDELKGRGYFRVYDPQGEHVATVKAKQLDETLAYYNGRRELDVDGNPIGEYTAQPFDGYVAGAR